MPPKDDPRLIRCLWLGSLLIILLVQVPGFGTVDTRYRWQVTRSLWTSAPAVEPGQYPAFGLVGKGGTLHAWYGLGQSIVMLPMDVLAASLEPLVSSTPEAGRRLVSVIVATGTFAPLNATTVVLAFFWLGQLGFKPRERLAGALALLLGSTFLHYSQIHMENSLMDALLFLDAVCLWSWLASGNRAWLAAASLVVAFALQVRLPVIIEHGALWLACLVLPVWPRPGHASGRPINRLHWLPLVAAGCLGVALGLVLDRLYHHHRFGSWTGTYLGIFGDQLRARHPGLPASFPWNGDFAEGFLGALFGPWRSVFLYDPLLVLLGFGLFRWPQIQPAVRVVLMGGAAALVASVALHAGYLFWDGSAAWGNRFTLVPVHWLALFAAPLALQFHGTWNRPARTGIAIILSLALALQMLSLLLPPQSETGLPGPPRHSRLLVFERLKLATRIMTGQSPPEGVPADSWRVNLAPCTLGRAMQGRLARPVLWTVWLGVLAGAVWTLRRASCLAEASPSPAKVAARPA